MAAYDAVVLAGGAARRLGGIDKPALEVNGTSLLDRALAAAAGASRIVVVGEERPTRLPVEWTMEKPPGGGPVAALAAGLALTRSPRVLVLAADLPHVDERVVGVLLAEPERDVIALDDQGHRQPLLAVYDAGRLRDAIGEGSSNAAMRDVLARLDPLEVGVGTAAADCDTWDDVARARGSEVSHSA